MQTIYNAYVSGCRVRCILLFKRLFGIVCVSLAARLTSRHLADIYRFRSHKLDLTYSSMVVSKKEWHVYIHSANVLTDHFSNSRFLHRCC